MLGFLDHLGRRFLSHIDPETGHALALKGLRITPGRTLGPDDPRLAVNAFGLNFPNPVGTAAGFDKNGEAIDPVLRAGFGFAEVGTVTPLPQAGNPRPRIFRLEKDAAVINRLGFNNHGHEAVEQRLAARAARSLSRVGGADGWTCRRARKPGTSSIASRRSLSS